MSTGKFGRPRRRRNLVGATVIVAFVVASLLIVGAASGRVAVQHSSAKRVAAGSLKSSTHIARHSLLHRFSSLSKARSSLLLSLSGSSAPLASITGCGADGTIAGGVALSASVNAPWPAPFLAAIRKK